MGADIKDLRDTVIALWKKRDDRYSELRTVQQVVTNPVEMHFIGG